jgi:hypothetical protein
VQERLLENVLDARGPVSTLTAGIRQARKHVGNYDEMAKAITRPLRITLRKHYWERHERLRCP